MEQMRIFICSTGNLNLVEYHYKNFPTASEIVCDNCLEMIRNNPIQFITHIEPFEKRPYFCSMCEMLHIKVPIV